MGITATPPCDQEAELLRTKFKLECGLHHPSFLFWGQSSYFSSLVFQPARRNQCHRQNQSLRAATGATMRGRSAIQLARRGRNRTLVEGENCGENDDGVLLETVACEDGNCTKDTPASSPKIETVPFTLFLGLLFFAFAK